jgi:hypothetical protein
MSNLSNDAGYESSGDNSDGSTTPQKQHWAEETIKSSAKDTRQQPWKNTFGGNIDNRLDDGEDLVEVSNTREGGDESDLAAIFKCKNSTLAA